MISITMKLEQGSRSDIMQLRAVIAENKQHMELVNEALSTFQSGLSRVQKEMLPIFTLTEQLRQTQKNIDAIVFELQSIKANFNLTTTLEPVLLGRRKYQHRIKYLEAIKQLLTVIDFLETHRTLENANKALDGAKDLLLQSKKKCLVEFEDAVSLCSQVPQERLESQWILINEHEISKALHLIDCLRAYKIQGEEIAQVYGEIRCQVLADLHTLEVDVATVENTPISFASLSSKSKTIQLLNKKLTNIEQLLRQEKGLAERLFSQEALAHFAYRHAVHTMVLKWKQQVESYVVSYTSTKHDDPMASLQLNEVIIAGTKSAASLLEPPLFVREVTGNGLKDPWILFQIFNSLMQESMTLTLQKVLAYPFQVTDRLNLNSQLLTQDANVHVATTEIVHFFRLISENPRPLITLFTTLKKSEQTNLTNAPAFLENLVTHLVQTYQRKLTQIKGCRSDLKHLFMANNYSYLFTNLPSAAIIKRQRNDGNREDENDGTDCDLEYITNGINAITMHLNDEIKPRFEKLRDEAIGIFISSSYIVFQKVVMDPEKMLQYVSIGTLKTLRKESCRVLKDIFMRFNLMLEDLHKHQSQYIVRDKDIQSQLKRTAVEIVLAAYTPFYEKYVTVPFTKKHRSKYLKYSPDQVNKLLQELFQSTYGDISCSDN